MVVCSGAARVTFSSQASFISAVSARFVQIIYGDVDKRVSEHVDCINFMYDVNT